MRYELTKSLSNCIKASQFLAMKRRDYIKVSHDEEAPYLIFTCVLASITNKSCFPRPLPPNSTHTRSTLLS